MTTRKTRPTLARRAPAPWPGAEAGRFERPSLTVDVVLISAAKGALRTWLVRRSEPPQADRWALPGGFIRPGEPLEAAAARVLRSKAGLGSLFLEQLYTFGAPDRDPRARVISIAYYALCDFSRFPSRAGTAPEATAARIEVPWEGETGGPVELIGDDGARLPLAFDHAEMVGLAVKRLRGKLDYAPIGFQLLPESFTLLELQQVHETIFGRPINKDSFRRRMLASGQLEATGERQVDVEHRPAERYRFSRRSAT
jgi:8-oxo-dGTP diphosphatase